ncbi:reverse transcriptase domain-containing protein, partial [Tanacetum coccineum]
MAPWPFYQWGMDILGPLPPARGGAKFVIVAIDYFTKWIEANPLVKITGKEEVRNSSNEHGSSTSSGQRSNGETPFSLTYDSEAVIPAEIGMPTYRTLMIREEYNEEYLLQERREAAAVKEAR